MLPLVPLLTSKPVLIGLGVVMFAGSIWGYGRVQYNKGYAEMELKYKQCQLEFKTEADKWNAQVEKQKNDLADLELKKKSTVKRNYDMFKQSSKGVKANKEKTDAAITTSIVPSATVRVPMGFVWVYNDAVEGSRIATGQQGGSSVPDYSLRAKGETVTFDAPYFTKVMKENVDQYNELAARCTKLIDVVVELEANYGDYLKGSVQPTGDAGGDILAGTVEAELF
jgi:hypothetical protein